MYLYNSWQWDSVIVDFCALAPKIYNNLLITHKK